MAEQRGYQRPKVILPFEIYIVDFEDLEAIKALQWILSGLFIVML